MNESLLTVRDVAKYFAVSTQTVARWEKSGELRSVRIGGSLRFTRQHLAEFIAAAETGRQCRALPLVVQQQPTTAKAI